jgi:hypothetical protein
VKMIARDTLISDPPKSLRSDLAWMSWADDKLDWVKRLSRAL